ncbi:hypothetical protein [Streptomyces sp. NBC_01304]|uniref:hypothetical protein n=1 Tax=Streptomyces sp. NBC_01304 TaxID=2903818 RepID=UPI002E1144ED|nr:hypothetical protein OG430_41605 [Streptomyces sp. NBC_01304]
MYQNATREQIITALQKGKSVNAIAAELRADRGRIRRIRDESGIPVHVPQYPTAEEKWQLYARPVEGGHREWTGPRASRGGTPVMRIGTTSHRPSGIAFRIRTGRDPVGQVKSECGLKHCVEPAHDDDEAGRREARAKLHPGPLTGRCKYGHERAEHGRFEPDGTAYCARCKYLDKNPAIDDRTKIAPAVTAEEAFQQRLQLTDGGHVLWTGPAHGSPVLPWKGTTVSAYRIAFRLHHGRDPEGPVTSACTVPLCVAGPCLLDRPMRQAGDRLFRTLFGPGA